MVSLREFYYMLEKHDWYHPFSDSSMVQFNGFINERKLSQIASTSKEHSELYIAFEDHFYSGKQFGCAKIDKPKFPEEDLK